MNNRNLPTCHKNIPKVALKAYSEYLIQRQEPPRSTDWPASPEIFCFVRSLQFASFQFEIHFNSIRTFERNRMGKNWNEANRIEEKGQKNSGGAGQSEPNYLPFPSILLPKAFFFLTKSESIFGISFFWISRIKLNKHNLNTKKKQTTSLHCKQQWTWYTINWLFVGQ